MKPRTEFIWASALLTTVLMVLAFVVIPSFWGSQSWRMSFRLVLVWAPAVAVALGVAAWLASAWHARSARAGKKPWSPSGMSFRTVLLVVVLFPLALALWLLVSSVFDQLFAAQPGDFREALGWLPMMVVYGFVIAMPTGVLPVFFFQYFLSRRYLRRVKQASFEAP